VNVAVKLVDDLIRRYYEEHGSFPDKIAYVLWATETMRNYGVMQAAVLYTIGVTVDWDSAERVKDVKLLNLSDLKIKLSNGTEIARPRIDVVVVSSGLHRDTFSALMQLLDIAVKLCIEANENEDQNYIKKHYLEIKRLLIEKGYNETEANFLAGIRIFSESPGNYGTGLSDAISASNTWQSDAKLAELFINRVGYAYGSLWGIESQEVFAMNLKATDIAVHSRSTNLFAALDNDDVFQYLGGIALAVRHLTGSNPETYIFEIRKADNPAVRTLSEFIATEILSRYFNPKWIEGMMGNDYSGAREMAKVIENLWGWEVVLPELISDRTWQNFYEIYVKDKYGLGLRDFFEESNPYAMQSIVARMLEAIRKDYWNAPEEVKLELAKELQRLQQEHGFTCRHHTCGNLELLNYAAGILSSIKEEEKREVKTTPRTKAGKGGGGTIQMPAAINETIQKPEVVRETTTASEATNQSTGFGFEQTMEPQQSRTEEEVAGYKVEVSEQPSSRFEISSTPIVAVLIAILAVLIFYAGMRRQR